MRFDIIVYRLRRLWRLVLLGWALPCGVVLYAALAGPGFAPLLFGLAVLFPLATVLRYSLQWHDTFVASFALSVCLALHFWLGSDLNGTAQALRFLWLSVLGVTIFLVLINPFCQMILWGPMRRFSPVAKGRSTLDIKTLRRAITLYPGRVSGRYRCGDADENGRFLVSTFIAQMDQLRLEPEGNVAEPALAAHSDDAVRADAHGRLLAEDYAKVVSAGPDHHEVQLFSEGAKGRRPQDAIRMRHDFTDLGGVIEVRQIEWDAEMPFGAAFGFWITDFMSDTLSEEIDRAEGRAARANRCFALHSLAIDLAHILVPLMGGLPKAPSSGQ